LILQITLYVSTQAIHAARIPNDAPQQPSGAAEVQQVQQNQRHAADSPVVITVGDSITSFGYEKDGWVTLLQQQYPDVTFMVSLAAMLSLMMDRNLRVGPMRRTQQGSSKKSCCTALMH
jgi:hypothetical protein